MNKDAKRAIRGSLLSFKDDPFVKPLEECVYYEPDGMVLIQNGHIIDVGSARTVLDRLQGESVPIDHYQGRLIMAGFIDCHAHFPQTPMIASHAKDLLDWLTRYTFHEEQQFGDISHAEEVAHVFLKEQFKNGITTSSVFCTVHPESVEALFRAASKYHMRLAAGKVCMDRNAPEKLLDSAEKAYSQSHQLIEKWHHNGRLEYVITPRFAPTSTEAQLAALGSLAEEYPTMLIQSHINENLGEVAWLHEVYPWADDYAAVYEEYGLIRPRAIYGHGIHMTEREEALFASTGASIAHCPTSNLFLGSGLCPVKALKGRGIPVGLATDVGGGTSFSMLQTMGEAYKVCQLLGEPYGPFQAFFLATLGSARALGMDQSIGSLEIGKEADLIVLNLTPTDLMSYRMIHANSLEETLGILMTLGDDRSVEATYINGDRVYIDFLPLD